MSANLKSILCLTLALTSLETAIANETKGKENQKNNKSTPTAEVSCESAWKTFVENNREGMTLEYKMVTKQSMAAAGMTMETIVEETETVKEASDKQVIVARQTKTSMKMPGMPTGMKMPGMTPKETSRTSTTTRSDFIDMCRKADKGGAIPNLPPHLAVEFGQEVLETRKEEIKVQAGVFNCDFRKSKTQHSMTDDKSGQSHETEATVESWSTERKGVHFTVKSIVNSQFAQGNSLMTRELVRVSLP